MGKFMHRARPLIFAALIISLFQNGGIANETSARNPAVARSEVRLDAPPYSMAHVSPIDQRPIPDCYANAAAEMIDAYRFSHGDKNPKFRTSALVLTAHYKELNGLNDFAGGLSCGAVKAVHNFGICNDLALRAQNGTRVEEYTAKYVSWQSQIEALASFQRALDSFNAEYRREIGAGGSGQPIPRLIQGQLACALKHDFENPFSTGLMEQLREITALLHLKSNVEIELSKLFRAFWKAKSVYFQNEREAEKKASADAQTIIQEMTKGEFSSKSLPSVARIKDLLMYSSPVELLDELTQKTCTGVNLERPHLPFCNSVHLAPAELASIHNLPKNADSITKAWAEKYVRKLSRAFDRPNPQPFSIGFCANIVENSGFDLHYPVTGMARACDMGHAALVMGKRTNPRTGRMDFLLRDSRNMACPSHVISQEWECAGPSTIWIDAEALVRNSWEVEGFDLPPL